MKDIDADKLYEYLEQVSEFYPRYADNFLDNAVINVINGIKTFIASLQPEYPDLPGIEDPGIPGKDFIPVEWVDACEMYGKWKIVRQEPEVDLEKEIKNYLATKCAGDDEPSVSEIARHFAEWGATYLNAGKEEGK